MAFTIHNISSFETQGQEELSSVTGSTSAVTSVSRTGAACLGLGPSATQNLATFPYVGQNGANTALVNTNLLIGFWFGTNDNTPASSYIFAQGDNGGWKLRFNTDATISLLDANDSVLGTSSQSIQQDTFELIELYYQNVDSGAAYEVWIDDTSVISGTGADLLGSPSTDAGVIFGGPPAGSGTAVFDDVYIGSDATTSDRLGSSMRVTFYNVDSGSTTGGDALTTGTWDLAGEIPYNLGASNRVEISTNNSESWAQTDGTNDSGPNGDATIGSTIVAAKWQAVIARNGGSDSTPYFAFGNSGDGLTTLSEALNTAATSHEPVRMAAATPVPTSSEYFRIGIGKGSGGRDPILGDALCYLLSYSPSTAHNLTASDVQSTSETDTPALSQAHVLTATDAESASETSAPAVGQAHALISTSVESASGLTAPNLSESNILLADDVQSTSEVGAPVIGQEHVLSQAGVESASEITSPAVGQEHGLTATDAESAAQLSSPALADFAGVDNLLADDVQSTSETATPAIGQGHALAAQDVQSASEVSQPSLSEISTSDDLLADDVQATSEVSAPLIGQTHVLAALGLESASQISLPALDGGAAPEEEKAPPMMVGGGVTAPTSGAGKAAQQSEDEAIIAMAMPLIVKEMFL